MRDPLARLDRERERVRDLRRPILEHVLLRQPVERVVDLDGRKPARIEAEHRVVLEIGGIERPLPLLERVPARPGPELHDALAALPGLASALSGLAAERLA